MSRGSLRRAMVFVDFSALRASLRWDLGQSGPQRVDPNCDLDFEKLGRRLCGDDQEFLRTNLYTGTPVRVDESGPRATIGRIELHEHEAFQSRGVTRGHQDLESNVDNRSRYTRLVCGRMMAHRVSFGFGDAYRWAREVFDRGFGDQLSDQDRELIENGIRVNQEAKQARDGLSRRLKEMKDQYQIPKEFMGEYSDRLGQLLGEELEFTEKGVDTKLTVEMLEMCMSDAYDDAILFAADEDYVPLVEAVKKTGRRVVHAFWDVPNCGWMLKSACDTSVLVPRGALPGLVHGDERS